MKFLWIKILFLAYQLHRWLQTHFLWKSISIYIRFIDSWQTLNQIRNNGIRYTSSYSSPITLIWCPNISFTLIDSYYSFLCTFVNIINNLTSINFYNWMLLHNVPISIISYFYRNRNRKLRKKVKTSFPSKQKNQTMLLSSIILPDNWYDISTSSN